EQEVLETLIYLSRQKIISYIPRRRTPLIYFPTSREEARYVEIGRAIYEDRKEIMGRRVEAMIDYATNSKGCRVSRMLRYFGESTARDCGSCDVCRAKRASDKKTNPAEMLQRMDRYLKEHPHGCTSRMLEADFGRLAAEATEALRYLVSEGFCEIRDDAYY
ncbi:MAG: RecQ family zinc-binding domain-containing protein, partial [Muribaculaceae bacterium]|nr:RecQ family zinc-binding domain-containing protein [Muribaculaceae bacterium]